MSLMEKAGEIRDRAEEAIDRHQVNREVEASAGRIAEGRKQYREQQEQNQRETEASAERIQSNRKIARQEEAGQISPALAERRRERAAGAYEAKKYSTKQKIEQGISSFKDSFMEEMTRPAAPRPARQAAPRQQAAPAQRYQPRPYRQQYDPFSFLAPLPAPRAPRRSARGSRQAPAPRPAPMFSIMDSEPFLFGRAPAAPARGKGRSAPAPTGGLLQSEIGFLQQPGKKNKGMWF